MRMYLETSTIADGTMAPVRNDVRARDARQRFCERIGCDYRAVALMLIPKPNGHTIVEVTSGGIYVGADALITTSPAVALGLTTADCVPLAMSDTEKGVLALAHCGWESVHAELPKFLVAHMLSLGAQRENIRARIGPSIRRESYVVPIQKLSQANDERWFPFLIHRGDDSCAVDLQGYIAAQCASQGLDPKHVDTEAADTFRDTSYFSHRRAVERGEVDGRMITIARLT